jgi:hypothetical protein
MLGEQLGESVRWMVGRAKMPLNPTSIWGRQPIRPIETPDPCQHNTDGTIPPSTPKHPSRRNLGTQKRVSFRVLPVRLMV